MMLRIKIDKIVAESGRNNALKLKIRKE